MRAIATGFCLSLMLGACAIEPAAPRLEDPLPRMFPVSANYPLALAGFEKIDVQVAADPFEGRLIRYRSASVAELELSVRIFLAGAFVSDQAAVDRVFAGARADLGADAQWVSEARERVEHEGSPARVGRVGIFNVGAPDGGMRQLQLASFFVDPYAVLVQSHYPPARASEFAPLIAIFTSAWIGAMQPDQAILCGPPEVVLVRDGLSNVSTNGRVIFLSTETDNIDAETIAELTRASMQQRKRIGCSAGAADFSAVEAAMRKRSRSR